MNESGAKSSHRSRPDWSLRRICHKGHRGCYRDDGWQCKVPECSPQRVIDWIDCELISEDA